MKYDVALSFSGDDREIARSINERLKSHGLRTFYDDEHAISLWGMNLTESLPVIYSKESRLCLIILSESYVKKVWTRVELRAALSKSIREPKEYLLVYRTDNVLPSSAPGLSDDVAYLNYQTHSPDNVADSIFKKLGYQFTFDDAKIIATQIAIRSLYDAYKAGTGRMSEGIVSDIYYWYPMFHVQKFGLRSWISMFIEAVCAEQIAKFLDDGSEILMLTEYGFSRACNYYSKVGDDIILNPKYYSHEYQEFI